MTETHRDLARCKQGKAFRVEVTEGTGIIKVDGIGSLAVEADIAHLGNPVANLNWMKDHLDACNSCYGHTNTCFLYNYTRGKNTQW